MLFYSLLLCSDADWSPNGLCNNLMPQEECETCIINIVSPLNTPASPYYYYYYDDDHKSKAMWQTQSEADDVQCQVLCFPPPKSLSSAGMRGSMSRTLRGEQEQHELNPDSCGLTITENTSYISVLCDVCGKLSLYTVAKCLLILNSLRNPTNGRPFSLYM